MALNLKGLMEANKHDEVIIYGHDITPTVHKIDRVMPTQVEIILPTKDGSGMVACRFRKKDGSEVGGSYLYRRHASAYTPEKLASLKVNYDPARRRLIDQIKRRVGRLSLEQLQQIGELMSSFKGDTDAD